MTWLRLARSTVVAALADGLDVPVLGYEPRGDVAGGVFVTVTVASCDADEVDLQVRAVCELRADRAVQDILDDLVDDIDVAVPAGVFLRSWSWDVDEELGALTATGTFFAHRFTGWCDPAPAP